MPAKNFPTQTQIYLSAIAAPSRQHRRMTTARCDLMPPGQSGTFHIVARCVRRSFLWGIDTYSSQNYDHRKTWVEQRILLLSNAFATC